MLIAIDTATRYAGIALLNPAKNQILGEETWYSVNNHTVQLMPRLDRLMEQQERATAVRKRRPKDDPRL